MTGSFVFNRQMSSTAGASTVDKSSQPKLRRCSSANEQNSLDPILDDALLKLKLATKRTQSPSDDDSGTEDVEPQVAPSSNHSEKNDEEEDAQSLVFEGCQDEGIGDTRAPTPANPEMWPVEKIEADRK